jgi:DNA-directed RNA polymerase specialized sigma subunit
MENRTRADIADRLGISASRVGQIITEQIRPKIHEWIKAEATRDKEIPESGTNKRAV